MGTLAVNMVMDGCVNVHKYVCSEHVRIHRATVISWNLQYNSRCWYNVVHIEVVFLVMVESIMSTLFLHYIL